MYKPVYIIGLKVKQAIDINLNNKKTCEYAGFYHFNDKYLERFHSGINFST